MANMSELKAEAVSKSYGRGAARTIALRGVNIRISKDELVALLGPSGSGKSTLINILGLIEKPDSGRIVLNGEEVSSAKSPWLIRGRRIAIIFQAFNLISRLTALENVALPLLVRGIPERIASAEAAATLERLGLGERKKARPSELSGGEQQRVAIARAIVSRSEYILADEPTGNLDSENAELVAGILLDLSKEGRGVLIATHNSDLATKATRVVRLKDGKIIEEYERRSAQ